MSTDKQIAANRLNALKSTGPNTPEGRDAVRLNGLKHGLTAETVVLPGESEKDFQALLDSYETEYRPSTPTEEALVQQLTMAMWRLQRLYRQEAGFYKHRSRDVADTPSYKQLKDDHNARQGLIVGWSQETLALFNRQEVRLERTFHRALDALQRLRKQRQSDLALVSPDPAETQPEAPTPERINDITPADPTPDPASSPENQIHLVPHTEDGR